MTTNTIDPQLAYDASRICAELAVDTDEPGVIRVAAEIVPKLADQVRRRCAAPGTEDDDLLAVVRSVGVLFERTN
ncbi:hypothetical protein [Streptomyces sp. NPDC017940]|uniref:hypothetical protein n=1 Tax=Streptomyces sp. NPDC017940 TaxID=3365017 RepID=UPI0037A2DB91